MAAITTDAAGVAAERNSQPKTRERTKRRKSGASDDSGERYFQVKTSGPDKMELGDEAASESEAMVTAFRTGGSFVVVTEWATNADLSNSQPVIKKITVRREKKHS